MMFFVFMTVLAVGFVAWWIHVEREVKREDAEMYELLRQIKERDGEQ